MKKLLLCLICLLSAFTITAYAEMVRPTIDSETGIITLSGVSSIQNGDVSVIITKPSVLVNNITLGGIKDQTAVVYSLPTAADGSFDGQFKLPARFATTYGHYTVYVTGETEQTFYYADPNEIVAAINAVDGATAETLPAILTEYTVTKEILAVNLSGEYVTYTDTPEKSLLFHTAMVTHIAPYDNLSMANITEAFNKAMETVKYAYGDKTVVEAAMTDNKIGVTYDSNLIDDIAEMFIGLRTKSADSTVITKEVRLAEALVKINAAAKGEMVGIIGIYNDVLLLNLSGDYTRVDPVEVNKPLLDPTFTDLATFQSAFAASLAVEVAKLNPPSGGGGGGGGGTVSVRNETPKEEEKEDTEPEAAEPKEPEKGEPAEDTKVSHFTDLGSASWAEKYVTALAEKKVIAGVGDGQFAPLDTVSREAFLTMLINAFGVETGDSKVDFADVNAGDWYAPYVAWGVGNGIVYGVDENNFGTGTSISREQMAVMTVRMMEKFGIELSGAETEFSDNDAIENYAKDAVGKMQAAKIINGMPDGSFAPKDSLNRAQAAVVIYQMMKAGGLDV